MAEQLAPEGGGPSNEGQPTGDTPISLNPDNQPIDSEPTTETPTAGGTTTTEPISDPVSEPTTTESTPTTGTTWTIPSGQYLRTRYDNLSFSGSPISSPEKDEYLEIFVPVPAYKYVPTVDFESAEGSEFNVAYRWQGYFNLDTSIYQFKLRASGGWRVKVNEVIVFDNYQGNGTTQQYVQVNRQMAAGKTLITVEWHPPIVNSYTIGVVSFSFGKVEEVTWLSCVDGQRRGGDPPEGWTLTQAGCWKPPEDEENPDLGNARDYIQILPDPAEGIDRTYVLLSGQSPTSHRLLVYNRSTNMTIAVAMVGPRIAYFTNAGSDDLVQGFSLQPQGIKEIDVKFKTSELDRLSEGLNASSIYAQLEVTNITIEDAPPTAPPLPPEQPDDGGDTIPEQPPEEPSPTVTWCDASSGTPVERLGYPPSDWVVRSDGCYVPAPTPSDIGELEFVFTETQPIVNTDGSVYAVASVFADISELGGDLTTFDYEWNFDVNGQGSAIADTTKSSAKPRWLVTLNDKSFIRNYGYMSRVIELIARRKGTTDVYRVKKMVKFTLVATALTQLEEAAQTEEQETTSTTEGGLLLGEEAIITETTDDVLLSSSDSTTTFTSPRLSTESDGSFEV